MSDERLQKEVLAELGEDRLQEVAELLGTDADSARRVVATSVATLTGALEDTAPAPENASERTRAQALSSVTTPAAKAASRKTGLPVAALAAAIHVLIPPTATVLARRSRAGAL